MPTGAWLPFSLLACNSTRTVYFPPRLRSFENAAACVTLVTVKCTWLKSTLRFTVKALTKFVTTAVEGTVSPVTLLASSCLPGKKKLSTTKRPMIASAITTRALGDRRGRFLSNDCDMLAQYSWFFLTRIYYSKFMHHGCGRKFCELNDPPSTSLEDAPIQRSSTENFLPQP